MDTAALPTASVTIKDVAAAAGVSPMTVSRVVHRTATVDPERAARVRQAIEALGYVPNGVARQLRGSRSGLIAAVLPTVQESIYLHIVEDLAKAFGEAGYQILVGQSNFRPEEEESLVCDLLGRRPDAIVLTGRLHTAAAHDRLARATVPVLEIWDHDPDAHFASIGFVHEEVGRAACDFFADRQRRVLACLGADEARSRRRCAAFAARARHRGLAPPFDHHLPPPTTVQAGRTGFRQLWERSDGRIDAVFCGSDLLAIGVLTEARALGLAPGAGLSILGFGDFPMGREMHPALSTVQIDMARMARLAVEWIGASREGSRAALRHDLGFRIVERGT